MENGNKSVRRKCLNPSKCQEKAYVKSVMSDLEEEDGFFQVGDRSAPRKRRDPSKWQRNVISQCKRDDYEKQAINSFPDRGHKKYNKKGKKKSKKKMNVLSAVKFKSTM